jgi:hypothetical protein
MEYEMAAPRKVTPKPKPKPNPKPDIPTDEPGQQPTPDADALSETEGASSVMAAIGAALAAGGVSASREQLDRAFTRDAFDTDIGYHEGLRWLTLQSFSGLVALGRTLDYQTGVKAMNKESVAHTQDTDGAFYGGLSKSDSTFHSGLLKGHGLETDNEVLSTVALAEVVKNLSNEVNAIKNAIAAAMPKTP